MLLLYVEGNQYNDSAVHKFTFHYASTLYVEKEIKKIHRMNLHSTMLLLYSYEGLIMKAETTFTFHYASTL